MTFVANPQLPEVVDSTMLGAFRVCPQRAYFEYVLGLRDARPSIDLHAGGAFASAREALYKASYGGADRQQALTAARSAFEEVWGGFVPEPGSKDEKSPKTKARTWEAVASYASEYGPPNDKLHPWPGAAENGFEWRFAFPLTPETTMFGNDATWPLHPTTGRPFLYGGRCDAIGLLDGSLPVVLDDKTTSRFDNVATWVAGLQMRAQFIGYNIGMRLLLDPTAEHALVRQTAIRTTGVEHRESPLITYGPHLRERWFRTTSATLRALVEAWRTGAFEAVLGDACVSWSRVCEFSEACRSPEPEMHLEGFVERRWSPLAAVETGVA